MCKTCDLLFVLSYFKLYSLDAHYTYIIMSSKIKFLSFFKKSFKLDQMCAIQRHYLTNTIKMSRL